MRQTLFAFAFIERNENISFETYPNLESIERSFIERHLTVGESSRKWRFWDKIIRHTFGRWRCDVASRCRVVNRRFGYMENGLSKNGGTCTFLGAAVIQPFWCHFRNRSTTGGIPSKPSIPTSIYKWTKSRVRKIFHSLETNESIRSAPPSAYRYKTSRKVENEVNNI